MTLEAFAVSFAIWANVAVFGVVAPIYHAAFG